MASVAFRHPRWRNPRWRNPRWRNPRWRPPKPGLFLSKGLQDIPHWTLRILKKMAGPEFSWGGGIYPTFCHCCCLIAQLFPTQCDPMDCSLPGSSVHGIFQTRILAWVAISFYKISHAVEQQSPCTTTIQLVLWSRREGAVGGRGGHHNFWRPCTVDPVSTRREIMSMRSPRVTGGYSLLLTSREKSTQQNRRNTAKINTYN